MTPSVESCGPVPGTWQTYKCLLLYDFAVGDALWSGSGVPFHMCPSLLSFRAICYSSFTNCIPHFPPRFQSLYFQIKLSLQSSAHMRTTAPCSFLWPSRLEVPSPSSIHYSFYLSPENGRYQDCNLCQGNKMDMQLGGTAELGLMHVWTMSINSVLERWGPWPDVPGPCATRMCKGSDPAVLLHTLCTRTFL